MGDGVGPVDVAALDAAWRASWSDVPPGAHRLRRRFAERWVRFHTLPDAKRYATTDPEEAEVLRRYRALLASLLGGDVEPDTRALVVVTCSWSATSVPTQRDSGVASIVPEAVHWRSDDLATEPGFHSWQHHHASRLTMADPEVDRLLVWVANDLTDGVIMMDETCAWVFHPYDGGMEIFTKTVEDRDRLAAQYADWLPPVSQPHRAERTAARRPSPDRGPRPWKPTPMTTESGTGDDSGEPASRVTVGD